MEAMTSTHVKEVRCLNTGGGCMVDQFILKDDTNICITDEAVCLYTGTDESLFDETEIGGLWITDYGDPDAYFEGGSNEWVDTLDIGTDDGIIEYDIIRMKNGIVIIIDDCQITVFESEESYQRSTTPSTLPDYVGIIQRP